jgi:hypothetical protein
VHKKESCFAHLLPILAIMGWLYEQINDFFCEDDDSYPEVCVCNLNETQICTAYQFIVEKSAYFVGKPFFFNRDKNAEQSIEEVSNAARLVAKGTAQPFHFMVRDIRFGKDQHIHELGVFIMPNAIALDYEKGRVWGELEIESFLMLLLLILQASKDSFLKLEETVVDEAKERFSRAVLDLAKENKEVIKDLAATYNEQN